jgi:hypothetical protein
VLSFFSHLASLCVSGTFSGVFSLVAFFFSVCVCALQLWWRVLLCFAVGARCWIMLLRSCAGGGRLTAQMLGWWWANKEDNNHRDFFE